MEKTPSKNVFLRLVSMEMAAIFDFRALTKDNRVKWETFGEESIPHYQVASWLLTVTYVECIAVDASNCTNIMYLYNIIIIVTKRTDLI